MAINFSPFPTLTTDRLKLRQLKITDQPEIFFLRSDPQVNEFLDRPQAKIINDALKFIKKINKGISRNEWIYWGIVLKDETKIIGTICLGNISVRDRKAEIGFELRPGFQGKGLMHEVLAKVIEYGFEGIKLKTIEGDVNPSNLKSINLMKRHGFVYYRTIERLKVYSLEKVS